MDSFQLLDLLVVAAAVVCGLARLDRRVSIRLLHTRSAHPRLLPIPVHSSRPSVWPSSRTLVPLLFDVEDR